MLSFILVLCIIGFNVKKINTFTTENAMYSFEIQEQKKYKYHADDEPNTKTLSLENNLDLIPKQFRDINKFGDININVYEFPDDISMKPCKYRDKYSNCFKFNI